MAMDLCGAGLMERGALYGMRLGEDGICKRAPGLLSLRTQGNKQRSKKTATDKDVEREDGNARSLE